jgi:predicted DNA-binding transcriptional regulator AlpA
MISQDVYMKNNTKIDSGDRLDGNDVLLDIKSVARQLSISLRGVWRAVARQELARPVKIGRCTRWFTSDVESLRQALKRQRGREVS